MDDQQVISLYEDTRHLANIAVWAVALQVKRLGAEEPDFADFPHQPLVDFHFLVTALTQVRQLAEALTAIDEMQPTIEEAIQSFDREVPQLRAIRNVLEHIGDYVRGRGHNNAVPYGGLFTIVLDPDCIKWLDYELRPSAALAASEALFNVIREKPPTAYARAAESHRNECPAC